MWGATFPYRLFWLFLTISTHTPHVGCDYVAGFLTNKPGGFQLTHPMWGATRLSKPPIDTIGISTHTPHVGCDLMLRQFWKHYQISTHTPHVGCDDTGRWNNRRMAGFQLTHPMWGATNSKFLLFPILKISTHTPHVGCDFVFFMFSSVYKISTHTPHVGCDWITIIEQRNREISTHTPHVGCDILQYTVMN